MRATEEFLQTFGILVELFGGVGRARFVGGPVTSMTLDKLIEKIPLTGDPLHFALSRPSDLDEMIILSRKFAAARGLILEIGSIPLGPIPAWIIARHGRSLLLTADLLPERALGGSRRGASTR